MLKRIFRLTLLLFLAWFLEPVLSTILPLPTEGMMDGILNLEKDSHQSLFKLCRYVVWVIFLAVMFRFTGPFLSFALPFSKRFSVTKPMRRFQGVFAEVFLFGLLFSILTILILPFATSSRYSTLLDEKIAGVVDDFDVEDEIKAVDIRLHDAAEDARGFVRLNRYKFSISQNDWPYNLPDIAGHYGDDIDVSYAAYVRDYKQIVRNDMLYVDFTKTERVNFRTVKKELTLAEIDEKYGDRYSDYTKEKLADLKKNYDYRLYSKYYTRPIYDLTKDAKYKEKLQNYSTLFNERKGLDNIRNSLPSLTKERNAFIKDVAQKRVWAEHKSALNLAMETFDGLWILFAILALVGYSATHFTDRTILGRAYTKFMMFIEQSRFGLGGSARFAGLFEEWALLFKKQKEGLFMGRSLYNSGLSIGLEDPRHMMTIAGSRAGKGTTSIIPNLLLWKGSALVIDPKGTNAAVTAQRRRDLGQDVHLIDPFNVLGEGEETASFNPLEWLDPKSPHIREQVSIIAEALVVPDQYQKEKHWDDGARTVIAGMIAHLVSSDQYENPNLSMLREMISTMPEDQAMLWADMSLNDGAGRMAKDAAHRVIRGAGTNEISGLISNADKHTEWLSSPSMVKTLGSSSFKFSDLKDKPTTLYLILPPEYLETHNRFLRLFVNLMISNMSIGGRAKTPVLLLMDEFLALGRMEEVEKAFGLMAGYNLIMWPFIQDLGRLQDLYGKSVNAFIANSRAVQVYGISDTETTEYVSNAVGDRSLNASYKSKPDRYNNVVKLRTPSEVAVDIAAETNRQYILRAGKAPLIIEKVPYYKSELFSGMYHADPDYKKD